MKGCVILTVLRKKSSVLTLVTLCLLALIVIGGIFNVYLTNNLESDAETINRFGIIRGATQRLVKLELAGIDSRKLKKDIEDRINKLNVDDIELYSKNNGNINVIEELNIIWEDLKEDINNHALNPSIQNKEKLITTSEEIWEKLDHIVLMTQISTENKIDRYKISFVFFGICTLIIITIIILIRRYVRNMLEYLVDQDGLTNIYNRRYFDERLKKEILKAEKHSCDLSLTILDIDYFKNVNDTYGHDIGDIVLREISELVEKNIRKNDVFSRIGGEEFAIISPNTDLESAFKLAEKIRKIIEKHKFNYPLQDITISLGVAQYLEDDNSLVLFKRADTLLYKAKKNGRNKACYL